MTETVDPSRPVRSARCRAERYLLDVASFHAEKPSEDFIEVLPRTVADPDEMTTSRWGELVEFREVTKTRREKGEFSDCMWVPGDMPTA